jgi:glycosyltransferase involved in cell wall biosynthesis
MRIVHIAKVKGIAGAERHLITLLPALTSAGFDVRMLVLEEPGHTIAPFRAALERGGVTVDVVAAPRHVAPGLVGRIADALRDVRADIVHTHMFHADVYGLRAARRLRTRVAVSSRHDNSPFRRRPHYRWLTRRTMRLADHVVTISNALARFVVDVEGVERRAISTIHYGLSIERPSRTPAEIRAELGMAGDGPVAGVVGRLVAQKGIDILIDAFPMVLARHPDATLLIAGDGPDRASLERRAARVGLGDRGRFIGWTDRPRDVMAACDVMVMPSRWEGFGLAALEAMACGRPVVASDVDALPEVVRHDESGLLVPVGDARSLAGAVNALLDRPDWAAALGAAGQCRARECFPVDRMVGATVDLYRRLYERTG